ncbi:MAG TPA: hypothetical protein DCS93_24680 [Microscillaceae bacterium]|nr:hypothetical protein [Microscillaceae bacterium]
MLINPNTGNSYQFDIQQVLDELDKVYGINNKTLAKKYFSRTGGWITKQKAHAKLAVAKRFLEKIEQIRDRLATPTHSKQAIEIINPDDNHPIKRDFTLSELELNGTYWVYNLDIHDEGVQVSKLVIDMHFQPAAKLTYINRDGKLIENSPLDANPISHGHTLLVSHNDEPLVLTIVLYLGINNPHLVTVQGLYTNIDNTGKPYSGTMVLQRIPKAIDNKHDVIVFPENPGRNQDHDTIPAKILYYLYNPTNPIQSTIPDIEPLFIHGTSKAFDLRDLELNLRPDYEAQAKYEGRYFLQISGSYLDHDIPFRDAPQYSDLLIKKYPFEIYKNPKTNQLESRLRVKNKRNNYTGKILNQHFYNEDYLPVLMCQNKNKILFLLIFKGTTPEPANRLIGFYTTHQRTSRSLDQGCFILEKTEIQSFESMEYEPVPLNKLNIENKHDVILGNFLIGRQKYTTQKDLSYYNTFQNKGEDVESDPHYKACKYAGNYAAYFYLQQDNGIKGIARNIIQINHFHQILYWGQKQVAGTQSLRGYIEDIGHQNLHLQISGEEDGVRREISYYVKTTDLESIPKEGHIFVGVYAFVTSREINRPVAGRVILQYLGLDYIENPQAEFIELPETEETRLPAEIKQALTGHTNNLITFPRHKNKIISNRNDLRQENCLEINMGEVFFRSACYLKENSKGIPEITKELERAILHGYSHKANIEEFLKADKEILKKIKIMPPLSRALHRIGISIL